MVTMSKVLTVFGEGVFTLGRRPEELFEADSPRRLAPNDKPPYKFAYARTALKYGLKAIGLKSGDGLLVPDLICDSAIEPLDELGIQPKYYPISPTLVPDWRQLEKLLTKSTKALLVVHYFGQPQPIRESQEFCREHSLMLVEDNAHGFGAKVNGSWNMRVEPTGGFVRTSRGGTGALSKVAAD